VSACKTCAAPLPSRRPGQRGRYREYCTPQCRYRAVNAGRRQYRPRLQQEPGVCKGCGAVILEPRNDRGRVRQYCGDGCYGLARWAKLIANGPCRGCGKQIPESARVREYCGKKCYDNHRIELRRAAQPPRPCEQCGQVFQSHLPTAKYCSPKCRSIRANQKRWKTTPRLCPTCATPIVRKGDHGYSKYCSLRCHHAARSAAAQANREAHKAEQAARTQFLECEECDTAFTALRARACCSPECRAERARRLKAPVRHGLKARKRNAPRTPTKCVCVECGSDFLGLARDAAYCSLRCTRKRYRRTHGAANKLRHRLRNREGLERFSRREIFERDGWTCHLCGEPCDQTASVPDPLAATIDHLIPLSQGGPHTRANVKCAHFSCNSARGTRPLAECA
jgi:endogenous inhibitor of DNA gyrase (YacG/DUF329 family)